MHKTLLLLRHAKSSHDEGQGDDFDRPLTPKGIKDCAKIGRYLKQHQLIPDLVLFSDAVRTTQTTQHILTALGKHPKLVPDHNLYLATAGEILKSIAKVPDPDSVHTLMVIVHNPGIHLLAKFLAGAMHENTKDLYRHYPTTGLTVFDIFSPHWKQIDSTLAKFRDFSYP
jgi:phosphohistidine phosphatase